LSRTILEHAPPVESENAGQPIALDGLAYGVDALDAILVFHLGDARLYATWVRPDAGLDAEEAAATLREAYRNNERTMRRLTRFATAGWSMGTTTMDWQAGGRDAGGARGSASPFVTLETPSRVALLRRIRSYVVATLFDGALPMGMARLVASRLARSLEPELPLTIDRVSMISELPEAPLDHGLDTSQDDDDEDTDAVPLVHTRALAFPTVDGVGRSRAPASRTEVERARRILAYLDAHAPEPHVVRLRLALRAGLTPIALEHPEALGADAMALIETAVEDMLGLERAELRSVL
jgi:hypothetical protein